MAIKTVFETSFALEKLLRLYGYTRSEPRFSISALGTTINIFSSNNCSQKKLILEILPPYYYKYNFTNFDLHELKEALDKFIENLKSICDKSDRFGLKIIVTVFHGGGTLVTSNGLREKIPILKPNIYPAEKQQLVHILEEDKKITEYQKKLPELEGIFE